MSEMILENFEKLDAAVVKKALKDLRLRGIHAISAARYFFLDGQGVYESDPCTFQALCLRNNIDPDSAAKVIWRKLPKKIQNELLRFLKKVGYTPATN